MSRELENDDLAWHKVEKEFYDRPDLHSGHLFSGEIRWIKPVPAILVMTGSNVLHLALVNGPENRALCLTPGGRIYPTGNRFQEDELNLPFELDAKSADLKERIRLIKEEKDVLMVFKTGIKIILHLYRSRAYLHGLLIRKIDFKPIEKGVKSCTDTRMAWTDLFRSSVCHSCNWGSDSSDDSLDKSLTLSETSESYCSCETSLRLEKSSPDKVGFSPRSASVLTVANVEWPKKDSNGNLAKNARQRALLSPKGRAPESLRRKRLPSSPQPGPSGKRPRVSGPGGR